MYFIPQLDLFGGDGHAYDGQDNNSGGRLYRHDRHGSGRLDHGAEFASIVKPDT